MYQEAAKQRQKTQHQQLTTSTDHLCSSSGGLWVAVMTCCFRSLFARSFVSCSADGGNHYEAWTAWTHGYYHSTYMGRVPLGLNQLPTPKLQPCLLHCQWLDRPDAIHVSQRAE